MTNLLLIRIKGRNGFTGAIVEDTTDPYPHFKVSCHKNGRKFLREPNYHERKRLHKYSQEHRTEVFKFEKAFHLEGGKTNNEM